MVPPVGIEPTLLSEPDFESGASTNSTTGAPRGVADLSKSARPVNRALAGIAPTVASASIAT